MRLQIAKILPLAFADTLRRICAERNDPEHLSTLYLRFGSILKRIREKRGLTIEGLSVLSGVREDTLEEAESGRIQITDPEMKICGTFTGLWQRIKPALAITNASWINA